MIYCLGWLKAEACRMRCRITFSSFLLCHICSVVEVQQKFCCCQAQRQDELIFIPSKVQTKNNAEISYPRLHLNHKEAKNTSLTSRLTSCRSETITQTFRFASPSGQLQQLAAGLCTRKWLRFDRTISNITLVIWESRLW